MSWYIPSEIAQLALTLVLGLFMLYLYTHDRKLYLLVWAYGWFIWSIKFVLEILMFDQGETPFLLALDLICWTVGAAFLPLGVLIFLGISITVLKYGIMLCAAWIVSSTLLGLPFAAQALVVFIFLGVSNMAAGVILLRDKKSALPGQWITGFCFLLLGVHLTDFPLLSQVEWFAPWGYLIAGVLTWITANGILLIYYQRIRKELSDSETRFRLLAENARDLIYRFRPGEKPEVEYVSPSAVEITGYSPEEFYADSRLFAEFLRSDMNSTTIEDAKNLLNTPIQWKQKQGNIIWIEHRSTPVYNRDGKLVAIEGIARDVTDRKNAEDQIKRLEESRRNLLSDISHDLRTPLTSVQGFVEALKDEVITDKEEVKKYLDVIHSRVLGINRLIRDLFQLTDLDAHQTTFYFSTVPINALLQKVEKKYRFEVEKKGLRFEMDVEGSPCAWEESESCRGVGAEVYVDMDRMDQIFTNLVNNAVNHTQPGGRVTVRCRVDIDKKEFVFSVKDTGYGISPANLPHIFDRFYKVSRAGSSGSRGSGLGLAITKELVKKHGGRIWVDSEVNKGTTVYFTLPMVPLYIPDSGKPLKNSNLPNDPKSCTPGDTRSKKPPGPPLNE